MALSVSALSQTLKFFNLNNFSSFVVYAWTWDAGTVVMPQVVKIAFWRLRV